MTESVQSKVTWDQGVVARSFETRLRPDAAAAAIRNHLESKGWNLSLADLADEDKPDAPRHEARQQSANSRTELVIRCSADRWEASSSKLIPLTDEARHALAAWVLRGAYPSGILTGGHVEVYYHLSFAVQIHVPDHESSPVRIDTEYVEAIDPYGKAIPEKERFSVHSHMNTFDPYPELEHSLSSVRGTGYP